MLRREIGDLYRTTCTICGWDAAVKYYLWVKLARCPECGESVPLFPGYLLAEAVRHPKWVFACSACLQLVELDERPGKGETTPCPHCGNPIGAAGPASAATCHAEMRPRHLLPGGLRLSAGAPDVGDRVPLRALQAEPPGTLLQVPERRGPRAL